MPFYPITDKRTGKSYKMPWENVTTRPSDDEIENFIYSQNNKSMLGRIGEAITTPLTDIASRTVKKISEPLRTYGEGGGLNIPLPKGLGGFGGGAGGLELAKPTEPGTDLSGWKYELGRNVGAFGTAFGEGLDTLTSPLSLGTMGAGGAGKALQATGVPYVSGAGTALTYAPRAAGAGGVVHGGYRMKEEFDPSNPMTAMGPGIEMALGALGARGGPRPKAPAAAPKPAIPPPVAPEIPPITRPPTTAPSATSMMQRPPGVPSSMGPLQRGMTPNLEVNLGNIPESPLLYDQPSIPPYIQRINQAFRESFPESTPEPPQSPWNPAMAENRKLMEHLGSRRALPAMTPEAERQMLFSEREAAARSRTPTTSPRTITGANRWVKPGEAAEDVLGRPQAVDELVSGKMQKTSYPKQEPPAGPKGKVKDPAFTAAEAKEVVNDPDSPLRKYISKTGLEKLKKLVTQEKGELDVDELISGVKSGRENLISGIKSAREKMLANIRAAEERDPFLKRPRQVIEAVTGKDVTDASLSGFYKSGWSHLNDLGEPGKRLTRLLQRARTDENINIAKQQAVDEAATPVGSHTGKAINRVGGEIWAKHKDEIEELLKQIPEEGRKTAKQIVDMQLGRIPDSRGAFDRGVESIKGIQALTKLSQFTLGNLPGVSSTFLRSNVGPALKGAGSVLFDYKNALAKAKQSGGLIEKIVQKGAFGSDVVSETKLGQLTNKLYGIEGSEKRLRSMSILAGRDTAEELFTQLKNNPNNKRALRRIDDLLLEDDMASVLKQDKLSEHQLNRAGARMSELTQGIAEPADLPPLWTGHPSVDLLTQFKRYGFTQTRNIIEAGKADPLRTAAALLTVFPAVGELVGDLKSGIKGAVSGALTDKDITEEVAKAIQGRGSTIGERYLKDMGQAWAFGLLGDYAEAAQRGPTGLAKEIVGPTFGDISEAGYGLEQLKEGKGYHLLRQGARMIPYVGTGIASTIKGEYTGRQRRRAREKREKN
jgi:hypothetical protein